MKQEKTMRESVNEFNENIRSLIYNFMGSFLIKLIRRIKYK